jgi:hypothetical protein
LGWRVRRIWGLGWRGFGVLGQERGRERGRGEEGGRGGGAGRERERERETGTDRIAETFQKSFCLTTSRDSFWMPCSAGFRSTQACKLRVGGFGFRV